MSELNRQTNKEAQKKTAFLSDDIVGETHSVASSVED